MTNFIKEQLVIVLDNKVPIKRWTNIQILQIDIHGNKFYYLNGHLHREDGPAVEYTSGTKEWYLNGKLHREDGPAVEWFDRNKAWYLNGRWTGDEQPANWEELVLLAQVEQVMNI